MEYCPHCMRPSGGIHCAHCGGEINWTAAPGQLPLSTMLRGSENHTYLIGAARGQGGFGITYAALDLNDNQRVAIKEYYPSRCALRSHLNKVIPMTGQNENYNSGLKSFLEEAMMLSAVGALPSVVTVKDYFEANGTAYLVMEFVDGVPLHEIVNKRGKIPASELLPKLDPLLQDLAILHKARVIHRDISPDNLMLMPDGSLKLLDFGSARSVQDGKAMTVLLKAGFSPVEQYQSRGQGPWTDVYALAGTIYYCLTGVVPPTAVERLDGDTLQLPNSLGADLTVPQQKALLWGLTVQPKARPADMEQFRQQLFGRSGPVRVEIPGRIKPPAHKKTVLLKDLEKKPAPRVTDATARNRIPDRPFSYGQEQTKREEPPKEERLKKKTVNLIVIVALVTLLIAGLAIILGVALSDDDDSHLYYTEEEDTTSPDASTTPDETEKPKETTPTETEPATITGETEDGYLYSIDKNSGTCTITGYTGSKSRLVFPTEIEGYTVTVIGERAFYKNRKIDSLYLPSDYAEVGDEAFYGSSVEDLLVLGDFHVGDSVFAQCDKLRCVVNASKRALNFTKHLPEDCRIYDYGMDVGDGALRYAHVEDNGVIYATTQDDHTVVMDIPDDVKEYKIMESWGAYPVTWIYEKALEGVSSSAKITMPAEALYPFELWDDVDWQTDDDTSLSACWWFSCYLSAYINKERGSSGPTILPDEALLRASMKRAQELSVSYDFARPNGEDWGTVLNEFDVTYKHAAMYRQKIEHSTDDEDTQNLLNVMKKIVDYWAAPQADFDNASYTHIALGMFFDADSQTYYCCSIAKVAQ